MDEAGLRALAAAGGGTFADARTRPQALASLYHKKLITMDTAIQRSSNADELKELIERGSGLNQSYGTGGPKPGPGGHASPYAQGRPVGSRPGAR